MERQEDTVLNGRIEMAEKTMTLRLAGEHVEKLRQVGVDYNIRGVTARVRRCIEEMPLKEESQAFDALFRRLHANYSALGEMTYRRKTIMYRFALLFGNLAKMGMIPEEDYQKAQVLFGDFGLEKDIDTETFLSAVPDALKKAAAGNLK